MDRNIVGLKGHGGPIRSPPTNILHDFGFADGHACGTRVNNVIGKEIVINLLIISGDSRKEILQLPGNITANLAVIGSTGSRERQHEHQRHGTCRVQSDPIGHVDRTTSALPYFIYAAPTS